MEDQEFRQNIDELKEKFSIAASGQSVGIVVPAAMEMVLGAILAIQAKDQALAATNSLRPMIDYIESQIQGTH